MKALPFCLGFLGYQACSCLKFTSKRENKTRNVHSRCGIFDLELPVCAVSGPDRISPKMYREFPKINAKFQTCGFHQSSGFTDLWLSFRVLLKIPDVVLLISLCRWSRKPFLLNDHFSSKSIKFS